MSGDRQEEKIEAAASDMEAGEQEMKEQLSELSAHIDEAKDAAQRRQDAPDTTEGPENGGPVAGDWEGESSGSQQGEDAEDAEGEQHGAGPDGEAEQAG